MRFLLSFLLLLFVVLRPESSPAHDGTGVSIGFTSPHGITVVEDSSLKITWDDGDVQEEALHRLFVQPRNIPPTHVPASKHVQGSLIHEVAVTDPTNSFSWDTSEVLPGVYALYALTTDPALCRHVEFALATILIRDPSVPMPLGVAITSPFDANVVGMDSATIEVVATAPFQPTLKLTAGTMIEAGEDHAENDPLCDPFRRIWSEARTIEEDVAMSADSERGEGWWKATVTWPMADLPNDFYAIRADLSAAGEDTFGWSHAFVAAVFGVPEPGDDLTTNTDVLGSDAGSLTDPSDPVPVPSPAVSDASSQQSGCRSGSQGASHLGFFLLGLTLLWYLRMRRVSAESYLESSMDDCSIQARGVR